MPGPTQDGFLAFVRGTMGIPADVLPDDAPVLALAFTYAQAFVVVNAFGFSVDIYTLLVYLLAADFLVNNAPDQPGETFFGQFRSSLGLDKFVPGIVQGAGDQGTSASLLVPDFYKNLTSFDLQLLKTPWGRQYFNIAQQLSPGAWGIT